jgi:hypothetical protein
VTGEERRAVVGTLVMVSTSRGPVANSSGAIIALDEPVPHGNVSNMM